MCSKFFLSTYELSYPVGPSLNSVPPQAWWEDHYLNDPPPTLSEEAGDRSSPILQHDKNPHPENGQIGRDSRKHRSLGLGRAVQIVKAGDHFLDPRLLYMDVHQLVFGGNPADQIRRCDHTRIEGQLGRISVATHDRHAGKIERGRRADEIDEQPPLGEHLLAQRDSND